MSLSRKCPGNGDRGCAKFLPNWDVHPLCRDCRSCTRGTTCEVCIEWSGALWTKHQKALDRAMVKKAAVSRGLSAEDSRVPGHTTIATSLVRPGDSADAAAAQVPLEPRSHEPSASRGVSSLTQRATPHRATSPRRRSKAHTLSPPCTSGTDTDSSGSQSGGFSRSPSAGSKLSLPRHRSRSYRSHGRRSRSRSRSNERDRRHRSTYRSTHGRRDDSSFRHRRRRSRSIARSRSRSRSRPRYPRGLSSSLSSPPFSGFSAVDRDRRIPDLGGLNSDQLTTLSQLIGLVHANSGTSDALHTRPSVVSATVPDPDPYDVAESESYPSAKLDLGPVPSEEAMDTHGPSAYVASQVPLVSMASHGPMATTASHGPHGCHS